MTFAPRHPLTSLRASFAVLVACGSPTLPASSSTHSDAQPADVDLAVTAHDAEPAIARLRARGPVGLEALLEAHAEGVAALRRGELDGNEALRHAIDAVGAQRDGHASGLYWYTDLDRAKAAASASHKPILSLRLLGRLDEELSCANSRFFRLMLYPDPRVRRLLQERFVLHWSTERPVPVVTVDMGDGRRLQRTLTGNSVHYVLDAAGRPLDAIPGLYSPRGFARALQQAEATWRACNEDGDLDECLRREHAAALAASERRLDGMRTPAAPPIAQLLATASPPPAAPQPSAFDAMPMAITKSGVELGALRAIDPSQGAAQPVDAYAPVFALPEVRFDDATRTLFRMKSGDDDDTRLDAMRSLVALDELQNEIRHRRAIHERLQTAPDFEALNAWVYTALFRAPRQDPWLGLRAPGLFDGIEHATR